MNTPNAFGPPPRVPPRERGPVRIGELLPAVLASYGISDMAEETPLKKTDIQTYMRVRQERLELERRATSLEKQEKTLFARMMAHVKANGGRKRVCELFGYILSIVMKGGTIAWKQEFVKACGQDKADAIKAPERESLSVTKLP